MNNPFNLICSLLANLLVIALLIRFAWIGNDKSFLAAIFYYFVLIVLNIIIWQVLDSYKKPAGRAYKITTTVLVIFTLPFCILTLMH